jgi:hypothetical protein
MSVIAGVGRYARVSRPLALVAVSLAGLRGEPACAGWSATAGRFLRGNALRHGRMPTAAAQPYPRRLSSVAWRRLAARRRRLRRRTCAAYRRCPIDRRVSALDS